MEINIVAKINSASETEINGITISDTIYNDGIVDYRLCDVEDEVDNLIMWISETTNDKQIMKDDLFYLMGIDDVYVFSSTSTNEYIAYSDNEDAYIRIGNELLDAQHELDK